MSYARPSPSYKPSQGRPLPTICMTDAGTESAWKTVALEAASKRARIFRSKQPWETAHFNGVFGPADCLQGTVLGMSANSLLPTQLGLHDVLTTRLGTSNCPEPEVAPRTVPVVALKYARRELPDEDVRRAALDKLRSLLVLDAEATHLGRSLQQIANRTSSPDLIEQSVSDCFRSKASSTLQKRASSSWRFSKLVRECGAKSPLRFTEEVLYNCLRLLRERGSGATSAQHILESLWFLDGTAKFAVINLATTVSGRCRGVARDMCKSLPARDQCILGQLLFRIHACCRWRDSQRVQRISLEEGSGEVLVYCEALSSKTSLTAESQTRFLPYGS